MFSFFIPVDVFAFPWMSYLFYPGVVFLIISEIVTHIKTLDRTTGDQSDNGTRPAMVITSFIFVLANFIFAHLEIGRMSNLTSS